MIHKKRLILNQTSLYHRKDRLIGKNKRDYLRRKRNEMRYYAYNERWMIKTEKLKRRKEMNRDVNKFEKSR